MADKRVGQIAGHLNYPRGMLAGQVAIITGSGQGIGAEAARLFANEGAKVVVSDIDGGKFAPETSAPVIVSLTLVSHSKGKRGCRQHK
jgi:NAD(P)-dependent dehydrogenase (short-subunit alcohol dehydrogenase family)